MFCSGCVGLPFPGVEARIVSEDGAVLAHVTHSKILQENSGKFLLKCMKSGGNVVINLANSHVKPTGIAV